MLTSVILIIASAVLFALIHSTLAENTVKSKCYAHGISQRQYRLLYSLIALLTTAVWLVFVSNLGDRNLYRISGIRGWPLHAVQIAALSLFLLSLKSVDIRPFLGLTAFKDGTEPFHEQGLYRYVRHPMYTSIMLMMFSQNTQSVNSLALFTVISIYFIVGSRFEEKRMLSSHPEYSDYCRRVPAFIPGLISGRKH